MPDLSERELSADEMTRAVFSAYERATQRASDEAKKPKPLIVSDVSITRARRGFVLTVKYRKQPDRAVTVRISRAWATNLRNRLDRELGG